MPQIVHRFDQICCPHCATVVTAAGEVDGGGVPIAGAGPRRGDLTLCPNCLQILAFRTDPLSLVDPQDEDLVDADPETVKALRQGREVLLATRPHRWLLMVKAADDGWTISAFGPVDKKDVQKRVHQIFASRRAAYVAEWCCPPREDQVRKLLEVAEHPDELMDLGSCVAFFAPVLSTGSVAES